MRWLRSAKTEYKNLTDEELLEIIHNDDQKALEELYDRYLHLVYGVCLKYLKNRELAQDATMQLFEKLQTLLLKHEINNFKSWLYATTRNHCLMIIRKKDLETVDMDNVLFMESTDEMHPIDETQHDQLDSLGTCIEELKEQQKRCVKLFYLEKYSYEEIVGDTGYDLKKVKSYLQNGKRNLKICLEKNGKEAESK